MLKIVFGLVQVEDLEPVFKFPLHLSVRKSQENYTQIYGISKANLWRNLSTGTPPSLETQGQIVEARKV